VRRTRSCRSPGARRWHGWAEEAAVNAPVLERCSHCEFEIVAPLEQALQAFAEHVCDRPRPTTTGRRRQD
jgi:hypothetical protein